MPSLAAVPVPSTTTLDLGPVERQILIECLAEEMQTLSKWTTEHFDNAPTLKEGDVIDARWKIERMTVCTALLAGLGFIEAREPGDLIGYAGYGVGRD